MKTRNIKNKITKIIIISLLLFINIKNVDAKGQAYKTEKVTNGTTDLTINRSTDEKKNFIVCSYACSADNAGADGSKCGSEGSTFSAIYYHVEDTHKWEIMTNIYLYPIEVHETGNFFEKVMINRDKDADPVISKYIFYEANSIIPSGGIYYESPSGSKKNEGWQNTEKYNTLKENFECPQFMYYDHTIELSYDNVTKWYGIGFTKEQAEAQAKKKQDKANNSMELCYANEKEKCMLRNEKDKTTFGKANNLNYSLTEELNTVFNGTNIELTNMEPSTILGRSFETKEDVCKALQNKMIDELINESTYENMLNEIFETKMRPDSPNKNMIDVQNIEKLILDIGYNNLDLKYNSESLKPKYEKLKEIYIKRLIDSKNYYANECNIDSSLIPDQQFETSSTEKLEKLTQPYQEIDYSELDCDTLFADMADIIKNAYFILEIIAVIIVIIRTALDYSKVFLSDEQDTLKKANIKLIKRIVVLVVILLLPALINLFLRIFKIEGFNSENPLCVKIK